MKINQIEIAGYESIDANIDFINNEITPVNYAKNFSCNDKTKGGLWYCYTFNSLIVTVICHKGSYGGTCGQWEIGIRDKDSGDWIDDSGYIAEGGGGVEGWKSWNEIQIILKKILADSMKEIDRESKERKPVKQSTSGMSLNSILSEI